MNNTSVTTTVFGHFTRGLYDRQMAECTKKLEVQKQKDGYIRELRNFLFVNHGHEDRLITGLCQECFVFNDDVNDIYSMRNVNYNTDDIQVLFNMWYNFVCH